MDPASWLSGKFEVCLCVPNPDERDDTPDEWLEDDCQSKKPKLLAFQTRGPLPQFFAVVKPKSQN